MSYDDMLSLTEERLAEQGVTKGARHKLALSIAKLQQRYSTLANMEKELLQSTREGSQPPLFTQSSTFLSNILDELKTILSTPLKPSNENDAQDIPAQFTKVLGKCKFREFVNLDFRSVELLNQNWHIGLFSVCSRLALESVDDGVLCSCINILEKVVQNDCFTQQQKEKVQQWRSRLGNPRPTPKYGLGFFSFWRGFDDLYFNVDFVFRRWQHNYSYNNRRHCNSQQHGTHNRKPSLNLGHVISANLHNSSFMMTPHRNSISTPYLQTNQSQNVSQSNLRPVHTTEKRPSLQETNLEVTRNGNFFPC